jgi:MFS family permease
VSIVHINVTPYLYTYRVWGAITFTIGAAIQAAAVDMLMLCIPRLLSGFGIGMLSMCSPVYIEEVAPESHRGSMGTLWQLAITAGILLASILNIFLADWDEGWRISYGGNIVFSVALLGLLTIMPESPHFLISKGRTDDARKALEKVRFDDQIDWEIEGKLTT